MTRTVYRKAPVTEDISWQTQGLCRSRDYPMDLWTPDPPNVEGKSEYPKHLCRTKCPVMMQCRKYALENHENYGVWGGLSEADRQAIWTGQRRRRYYRHYS